MLVWVGNFNIFALVRHTHTHKARYFISHLALMLCSAQQWTLCGSCAGRLHVSGLYCSLSPRDSLPLQSGRRDLWKTHTHTHTNWTHTLYLRGSGLIWFGYRDIRNSHKNVTGGLCFSQLFCLRSLIKRLSPVLHFFLWIAKLNFFLKVVFLLLFLQFV